jgi:hypothetical protein
MEFEGYAARHQFLPYSADSAWCITEIWIADVRFGSKADIAERDQDVRFVPTAKSH